MPNAIRVLEAFVLDDPGSGFLDAVQNGSERPWFGVDRRVFDPCFVLDRIGTGHPVTFHDVDLIAVKVSCLVEPKMIGQRNDVGNQGVSRPSVARVPSTSPRCRSAAGCPDEKHGRRDFPGRQSQSCPGSEESAEE